MKGFLVSFEGISGCGKTYFFKLLHQELQDIPTTFVSEISDRTGNSLDRMIIEILTHTGDRFFRTGYPLTETFLILALKMFDCESTISEALSTGYLVVEDRSVDTIAVYQAILLNQDNPENLKETLNIANKICRLAAEWRCIPDLTFLLKVNFDVAVYRTQKRLGRKLADDELALLRTAARIYEMYADQHQHRIVQLDTDSMGNAQILEEIKCKTIERVRT